MYKKETKCLVNQKGDEPTDRQTNDERTRWTDKHTDQQQQIIDVNRGKTLVKSRPLENFFPPIERRKGNNSRKSVTWSAVPDAPKLVYVGMRL